MANNKGRKFETIALIGGVTLIVSGIAWKLLASKKTTSAKPKAAAKVQQPAPVVPNSAQSAQSTYATGFPLKKGSNNSFVVQLQNALTALGYPLVADGIFGTKTNNALVDYSGTNSVESPQDLQAIIDASSTSNYGTGDMLTNPDNTYNPISNLYQ